MKILSLSWFGFAVLTLVHAVSIPVTDEPVSPAEAADDLATHDDPFYPDHPPTEDYGGDWMGVTNGDYHGDFTCPDGWTKHSTQCLLFVPQNMTWNEAKENCASKGEGSLAAVYNEIQADEIYNEVESAGHHGGPVWVGGSKTSEDPSWSWVDSFFSGFAKFCDEQSSHDEKNCLEISFDADSSSGCLNGRKCDAELPSVCAILLY
ncbi:type-2 ice-structuring protein-like isoform X5 [Poecilia formosa]|uniref:type-2 ice-structuring protein-like isoform X5 n=1 Tax=Poecilia formosa TaxID=48698 RepID=UPI0004445271|nr:PREDICTED: type-2 ice-structuring protein-like isoform X5 [Poecilia formosa]